MKKRSDSQITAKSMHQNRAVKTDFQVFAKPVGQRCNMACDYCYYSNGSKCSGPDLRMSDDVLDRYIRQHIHAHPGPVVRFSWHGGEPLLSGINFFKQVVAIQKKYRPSGILIQNGIQTNGMLLDNTWCDFFKKEGFTIGLSLDGPQSLHDQYRTTSSGRGTHSQVMSGQALLKQYTIPHDILCVVHHHNVDHPLEVYHFFKTIGATYIGFLPVVNALAPGVDGVDPEKYGAFLCAVFDEWKTYDIGRIKIQICEEVAAAAMGQDHRLCIFRTTCGEIPVVEIQGDVYACDHFVRPEYHLGNLKVTPLGNMINSKPMRAFGNHKQSSLPPQCTACDVLRFCNGGCPKDRVNQIPGIPFKLNYLCQGYKRFFHHCLPFVEQLEQFALHQGSTPKKIGRNSPCSCGSGKKFKQCCMPS